MFAKEKRASRITVENHAVYFGTETLLIPAFETNTYLTHRTMINIKSRSCIMIVRDLD